MEMLKSDGTEGIYLFCFASSSLLSSIEGTGVDGLSPLFLLKHEGISAVLSVAALDQFSETRMQDLGWVGQRAVRHERVVEDVMRRSPVMPARFGTIFSSLENVERRIREHHDDIARFLERISGKGEWGLKGYVNRSKAREVLHTEMLAGRGDALSTSPGARYLQEQRLRAEVEKTLNQWLRGVGEELAASLTPLDLDACVRKVLSRSPSEDGMEMFLNWAFLIPPDALPGFHARIDRANVEYEPRGLIFHPSGPWPPYSFCPVLKTESEE